MDADLNDVQLIGYDNEAITKEVKLMDYEDLQKQEESDDQKQLLECKQKCKIQRLKKQKKDQHIINVFTNVFFIFCSFLFVLFIDQVSKGVLFIFFVMFMVSVYMFLKMMLPPF